MIIRRIFWRIDPQNIQYLPAVNPALGRFFFFELG
jgi:hypothetical protein